MLQGALCMQSPLFSVRSVACGPTCFRSLLPVDADSQPILSPCIGLCELGPDGLCLGCFRTGQEISRWGYVDNEGKTAILKKVEARMLGQQIP